LSDISAASAGWAAKRTVKANRQMSEATEKGWMIFLARGNEFMDDWLINDQHDG
jgi:hypothetical protein